MPMHGLEGGSRELAAEKIAAEKAAEKAVAEKVAARTGPIAFGNSRSVTCRSNGRYRNCSIVLRSHTQSQSVPQPWSSYMYKYKY